MSTDRFVDRLLNKSRYNIAMFRFLIFFILSICAYADSVDGRSELHNLVYYEKYDDVIELLKKGADLEVINAAGLTPMHIAIKKRDLKMANILLDNGADINSQDNRGNTPLIVAVKKRNIKLVRFLILKGADVNLYNDEGITPLHQAAYSGNPEIVEFLLSSGADHKARSRSGYSAFEFALKSNNLAVIDVLKLYEKENKR